MEVVGLVELVAVFWFRLGTGGTVCELGVDSGVGSTDEVLNGFSVEEDVFKAIVHPAPEVEGFDIGFEGGEGGVGVDGEFIEEVLGIELGIGGDSGNKRQVVGVKIARDGGCVREEQFFAEGECLVFIEQGSEELLVGGGDGFDGSKGVCEELDVVQEEGVDGGEVVGVEVFGYFFGDGLCEIGVVVEREREGAFREDFLEVGEVGLIESSNKACFVHAVASCTSCDLPDEVGVNLFFIDSIPFGGGGEVDARNGEIESKSDGVGSDKDIGLTGGKELGLFAADIWGEGAVDDGWVSTVVFEVFCDSEDVFAREGDECACGGKAFGGEAGGGGAGGNL